MIGIRVDVNHKIATGHIRRDIAVALCLRQLGEACLFISADDNSIPYLEPYGFQSVVLHTAWDDMDGELEALEAVIRQYDITSLLVDSYQVTEHYMTQLSARTVVTYFDELYRLGYGCQQVINGVLVPPDYTMSGARALLGADYVALREEFYALPAKKVRPQIEKILITSGGTDNYHFCREFLDFFLQRPEWRNVKVMAVIGELSTDKKLLCERYRDEERVELHINTTRMSELMQDADYAVTAGGTSLYEACAVGVTASCYAIADNQVEIAQSFEDRGLVSYAGDFREGKEQTFARILAAMKEAETEAYRRAKAEKVQRIVDGRGAYRIAQALISICDRFGEEN